MEETKFETFWNVVAPKKSGDSKKIVFNLNKYLYWIQGCGFFKKNNGDGGFLLVRIVDNIVSQVYQHMISSFILNYLRSLPEWIDGLAKDQFINWYGNNYNKMVSESVFYLLETKELDFYRDNMYQAKIFFGNSVVCVDKDEVKSVPYKSFEGTIWKDQIIRREIQITDFKNQGMFEVFLSNIFGKSEVNLDAVMTAIGYLLHNYKPTSYAPAIVLNDKVISDNPDGGTGKGIFAKAIGQFKNGVTIDGKSFDFNKSFAFQRVEQFTDLLIFDDVKSNFSFEKLFSIITEGITVEKKNKGEFFIPFEHSPKILITTNYALKGEGNSIERRKVDFELEQYYSQAKTPMDEFGKMFFSEWNADEWSQFDNFMIHCIQRYLKRGIVLPRNENLAEKRLTANTCSAFIEFMEDFDDLGKEIDKNKMLDRFLGATNMRNVKSNTLTKWLKQYCEFHHLQFKEGRKAGARTLTIGRIEGQQSELKGFK